MQIEYFVAGTDIVVIGQNVEMADYDNPRGYVYGFAAYVQAVSPQGETRVLSLGAGNSEAAMLAEADAQAAALNARLAAGKAPVGFDRWVEGRPVYGSEAYSAYGQADDVEWERCQADEEAWA